MFDFTGSSVKRLLSVLETEMTPDQIAEAQRLAREWAAAHPRESDVLFLLNRPPPHAMLNASPFVIVVEEEL